MSEQKSFFSTLPGIITALAGLVTAAAGLIYALSETGLIGSRAEKETQPTAVTSPKPATVESKTPVTKAPKTPVAEAPKKSVATTPQTKAVAPKQPMAVAPTTPKAQTTDGWMIIGYYQQGKFSDLTIRVHGDSPAIGRSYEAVDNFRLIQKRPERGQATITLGMVHRGDSVEVLDIEIAPGTSKAPVWAKLRAVLHPIKESSR